MKARYFRLTEMHQQLDDKLRREMRNRFPDQLQIRKLKTLKLRIKDALYRLEPKAA